MSKRPHSSANETRILGINFRTRDVQAAMDRLCSDGGLLVAPAAPALEELPRNAAYREALLHADLVIPDSSFMLRSWLLLEREWLCAFSGLRWLDEALDRPDVRAPGNTLWVMANSASSRRNLAYLRNRRGIAIAPDYVYKAPVYGRPVQDMRLVEQLEARPVRHIVLTVGGGVQEPLGYFLKTHLSYRPAIHCVGAAIAFLSGDQVRIPAWADRLALGCLFRCLSRPARYVPRYASAFKLFPLLWRYRAVLPPERPLLAASNRSTGQNRLSGLAILLATIRLVYRNRLHPIRGR